MKHCGKPSDNEMAGFTGFCFEILKASTTVALSIITLENKENMLRHQHHSKMIYLMYVYPALPIKLYRIDLYQHSEGKSCSAKVNDVAV